MYIRASYNQADLDRMRRGFATALAAESLRTARHVAGRAVDQLRRFDSAAGRFALAALWTSDVEQTPTGARATVYSAAEEMLFFNETGDRERGRVRSAEYPIQGSRLLAILEAGARPHAIPARKNGWLVYPSGPSARSQAYVFAERWGMLAGGASDTRFVPGALAAHPEFHPGVRGSHNIETTRQMLLDSLAQEGTELAARVRVDLV